MGISGDSKATDGTTGGAEDKNWRPAGMFSMDPLAMPAEIDYVSRQGCYEFATYQLGIYELDGDLLRICITYSETSGTRPDVFESPQGSNNVTLLLVLRRVTEEDDE